MAKQREFPVDNVDIVERIVRRSAAPSATKT
jgi:hypothetical protein